jgi:hypothetical protein
MSAIPQSLFDPAFTTSGKPFISTNREGSGRFSQQLFNSQITDSVTQSLEGTPKMQRFTRKKPSIMKYPIDIGTAQVPHAMQFKIFWRWESKDLTEGLNSAKAESSKRIGNMNTLASLIDGGNLTPDMLARSPLNDDQVAALKDLVNDPSYVRAVDPSSNDNIATLLQTNPGKARQILEQTVWAEQSRLSSIEAELTNGAGKIGLDERERLQVQNRLSENIESGSVGQGVVNTAAYSGIGGLAAGAIGLLTGAGVRGSLTAAGVVAGGGLAVGLAGVAGAAVAKEFKTEAVYDQMVSIYLPFCTKVNNEDSFQYEDSNQSVAGAAFDALGGELSPSLRQGIAAGAQILGDKFAGGAVQSARGEVINPRLEKLFRQKDFRNFAFSWEFYPRNKAEVDTIRDIIETFRYHAHPATSENAGTDESNQVQIVLRTPAEFEIRFLSSNPNINQVGFVENEYLPKIGRCALNSISVDYTANSIFSTFKDNSPTAITMTLNFSEMGQLTRETVDKGF